MRLFSFFVCAAVAGSAVGCAFRVSPLLSDGGGTDSGSSWATDRSAVLRAITAITADASAEQDALVQWAAPDSGADRWPVDDDGGTDDSGLPLDAATAKDSGTDAGEPDASPDTSTGSPDFSGACEPCESDAQCGANLRCAGADGRDEQCLGDQCTDLRRCVVEPTTDCREAFGSDHYTFPSTGLCTPYPAYRCDEPGPNCQPTSWSTWCGLWLMGTL